MPRRTSRSRSRTFAALGGLTLLASAPAVAAPSTPSPLNTYSGSHLLPLGGALIAAAFLLGRFAPEKRRRLRPSVILYGTYVLAVTTQACFHWAAWRDRARVAGWVAELLVVLIAINIAALVAFELVLRALRIRPANIVSDLVIGVAYIVAFLGGLGRIGVNLSGIIATSAVVSAVLGLSLAPTLGNILGGVALQLDNSIHEGDWVQLDATTQGRVIAIRWRHTVVETRNWDTIIVPNATLLAGNITILGKRSGQPIQRRYTVNFNVDHRWPPERVVAAVTEALREHALPGVAREPRPHVVCLDLARAEREGFAHYGVRYWLTDLAVDDGTNSLIREHVVAALRRAEIALAIPRHAVFVPGTEAERGALEAPGERARRVALLGRLELFAHFAPEELDHLAGLLTYAPFARGEVMARQGGDAEWVYLLASGAADVVVQLADGSAERVGAITAPDFFGEMAVMTGEPRSASVIATVASECYRLDKAAFKAILAERGELAERVSLVLARRQSELAAVRENLDDDQKSLRLADENIRLFSQIQLFLGLTDDRPRRK